MWYKYDFYISIAGECFDTFKVFLGLLNFLHLVECLHFIFKVLSGWWKAPLIQEKHA